ncbi:hypothetical protein BJ912DRAFT_999536 [Pholiota molesta]|nr:hypothetical protein BJ912DRAFT_999536 [Pholiota molesta]
MQFKVLIFLATQIVAILALMGRDDSAHTRIAKKIYHTVIDESPYLVDRTSTVVWTESASITDTTLPTTAPTPTIGY